MANKPMATKSEQMMEVWLRDHTPPTSEDIGKIATALALLGHTLRNGEKWDATCEQYSKDAHEALTKIGAFHGMTSAAPQMYDALLNVRSIVSEAAMTGFNWKDGDWPDRLFHSQQKTTAAIKAAAASRG